MDLSLIKAKLAASQQKPGQKYEKVDYSKYYWKPKAGKHQIRVVPSKFNKQNPFREVFLHYGFAKFPIIALTNWGEQDPIVEFAKQLRKSKDKEDWQLAKKVEPKMRVFIPVIVRGEEHLGVRLWEFGKEIYQQLLGIAADEDYGDYTDITDGRDFTVEATEAEAMGKKIIKCALRIKPKTSPLSENSADVEKFLSDQPDILSLYKKHSFEDLKNILQKWMNPEEEVEDVVPAVSSDEDENEDQPSDLPWENQSQKTYTPEPKATKKTSADKFNALFDEN
jgi:hypothetical protein